MQKVNHELTACKLVNSMITLHDPSHRGMYLCSGRRMRFADITKHYLIEHVLLQAWSSTRYNPTYGLSIASRTHEIGPLDLESTHPDRMSNSKSQTP